MDQENRSDVIVIDDDPCIPSTSTTENTNEIEDDIVSLFYKLFPEPVVDLSDRNAEKDKKGTACSNVRCNNDEDLISPSQSALSYYNLPNKSLLICKPCCAVADDFMKDLLEKYYNRECLYDCKFPPTNPVVVIDSDSSSESENAETLKTFSTEDNAYLEELSKTLIEKHMTTYNPLKQLEDGKIILEKTLTELQDKYALLVENINADTNELSKSLKSLYEAFAPKIETLEPLDIPYEEMRPSVLHRRKNQHKRILEQPTIIMDNLPPYGPLVHPKPEIGQKYYVMKSDNFSEWLPATVLAKLENKDKWLDQLENRYLVRLEYKPSLNRSECKFIQKDVNESYIAYFNPPPFRLHLRSRIIAIFNSESNKFFAGIVAEPPASNNHFRYLVFFDDGYAQYVRHEDTRLIVKEKANVSDYFPINSGIFIKEYFNTYPERPMLKIKVMDSVRVMRNGSWENCRVMNVDASLILVLFLKENYSEWIYRGSNRLRPLFDHFKLAQRFVRKRLPRTDITTSNGPFVQYSLVTSSSDSENDYTTGSGSIVSTAETIADRKRRAVAKKSTNRLPDIIDPPSPPLIKRYSKRIIRQMYGRIETLIPSNTVQPAPFKKHLCTPNCVVSVNYDERKTKGVNPLIVPILFGFRRDSDMNLIFYYSPCGKRLRSMVDVLKFTTDTRIPIALDHFDFDPSVHIYDEFIVPEQHILLKDLSRGQERVPIPVVNCIDAKIPDMMEYMTERRGLEGVYLNLDENFLVGCDCTDNCQNRAFCSCQRMTVTEAKAWSKYFYIERPELAGYENRRLSHGLPSGIWECNNRCKCCKKTCLNRVAQYPLKVKLQLFKTKKKGWGVRCVNDLPSGTFICVYNGNILTEHNANEGGLRFGDEYFAELDYIECMEGTKANYEPTVIMPENIVSDAEVNNSGDEFDQEMFMNRQNDVKRRAMRQNRKSSSIRSARSSESPVSSESEEVICRQPQSFAVDRDDDFDEEDDDELPYPSVRKLFGRDEAVYVMDAKTAGNIGRYFNHSCDPNVHVQSVFVDTHDLRFPWIAFFSQKYIRAGTELTWDYRYEPGKVPGKRLICYCGASNCRKRLL